MVEQLDAQVGRLLDALAQSGSGHKGESSQTGARKLPQVFVGGATDAFDAWRNRSLQKRPDQAGVSFDHETTLDPYSLLPKWLQPRKCA